MHRNSMVDIQEANGITILWGYDQSKRGFSKITNGKIL